MSVATVPEMSSRERRPVRAVIDPASGHRLAVATPAADRVTWRRYLDGARAVYRAHGVDAALDYDAVVDGESTTLFVVVTADDGRVLGGLRAQGPYDAVEQTHALHEWEGCSGRAALVDAISSRLPAGVVEVKTAWVDPRVDNPSEVSALLARVAMPILTATGARFLMATAAEHVLRRWSTSGGRVDRSVAPSPYPDERYRTSLMWWDTASLETHADPEVFARMRHDTTALFGDEMLYRQRVA